MLHVTLCAKSLSIHALTFGPACSSKSAIMPPARNARSIMPQLQRAREAERQRATLTRSCPAIITSDSGSSSKPSTLRPELTPPVVTLPALEFERDVKCFGAAEKFLCVGYLTFRIFAPAKAFGTPMRRVVEPPKETALRFIVPDRGCSERKQAQRLVFGRRRLGYERRIASESY
ncbi:hypothetical protein BGW80DRAFT_289961 [Lactifluus volemus]|nr:hypothetical protein BGW80DRAFT_289961 [Lactifluus volemus]